MLRMREATGGAGGDAVENRSAVDRDEALRVDPELTEECWH